ncbi:MAG: CopG family transcriptional regulator [Chloroflexota bacterium]
MMVQLTEEQVKALKEMSKARKTPVAKLVRESVAYYVASSTQLSAQERRKRANAIRSVAGRYRDIERAKDLSTNHDKYLEDAFAS